MGKIGSLPLRSGQLFLFTGDSITDCGRRGAQAPYGDGYMSLFRELAIARHPDRAIRWLNRGIGGNTVLDLKQRWEDDVIREQPDWISVMIGINDLHRHLRRDPAAVGPGLFRSTYHEILARSRKAARARLVLLDPFYLSTDRDSGSFRAQVLKLLAQYTRIVRDLARTFSALHVPTQRLFERQMAHRPPNDFAPEPVHPCRAGHLVIAQALYETLCAGR